MGDLFERISEKVSRIGKPTYEEYVQDFLSKSKGYTEWDALQAAAYGVKTGSVLPDELYYELVQGEAPRLLSGIEGLKPVLTKSNVTGMSAVYDEAPQDAQEGDFISDGNRWYKASMEEMEGGEPVLVLKPTAFEVMNKDKWTPGTIKRAGERGEYAAPSDSRGRKPDLGSFLRSIIPIDFNPELQQQIGAGMEKAAGRL